MSDDGGADHFEDAPCGLMILLANGRIHRVNRRMCGWLGMDATSVVGQRFTDYLNMGGRIFYETHISPLLRLQGGFDEFAIDMLAADGRVLQLIANASENRDAEGKVKSIQFALFNAKERRRYEQQLLQAREDARSMLADEQTTSELREQFIAVLGHDLRNPLASINAGARVLRRSATTDKDRAVLAMMETTVLRMAGLIDNVLDFARGRLGGGITLTRAVVADVQPVLEQVVDEIRAASPDQIIETTYDIRHPVVCDRSRLGQLVSNLLGNALTHGDPNIPIHMTAVTEPEHFTLSVSNGGKPIPPASIDKLFEPFVRGEGSDSRQGLGLGLYIASQIARAHGGRLTVTSSPQETRFTFGMPLSGD